MPLYEMDCLECEHKDTYLVKSQAEVVHERCKQCGSDQLQMCLSTFGTYSIKGNNSASVTPKKHRGGRPS